MQYFCSSEKIKVGFKVERYPVVKPSGNLATYFLSISLTYWLIDFLKVWFLLVKIENSGMYYVQKL